MGTVKRCHNLVIKGDDFRCKSTHVCYRHSCFESEAERIYLYHGHLHREKKQHLFSNQEQEEL